MAIRSLPPAEEAFTALLDLGPACARWLVAAGIASPDELRARGAVAVFHQVAMHRAGDVSLNLLYALEGAVRGVRRDRLAPDVRAALRRAAEAPVPAASIDESTLHPTTTRRRP